MPRKTSQPKCRKQADRLIEKSFKLTREVLEVGENLFKILRELEILEKSGAIDSIDPKEQEKINQYFERYAPNLPDDPDVAKEMEKMENMRADLEEKEKLYFGKKKKTKKKKALKGGMIMDTMESVIGNHQKMETITLKSIEIRFKLINECAAILGPLPENEMKQFGEYLETYLPSWFQEDLPEWMEETLPEEKKELARRKKNFQAVKRRRSSRGGNKRRSSAGKKK